jgi:hypothetical protein
MLAWDANTEPDLAGYKLYYKRGSSGAAYDGGGAVEGPSPIDVGDVTVYTITGLSDTEDCFFVVTAYDTEVLESDYSDEVSTNSRSINQVPIADAGSDQTVDEGLTVTLSGVNS